MIKKLLDQSTDDGYSKPPEAGGVYVVSRKNWDDFPDSKCIPLYVGSNTGKSPRFRTRVGDLLADTFGFFGKSTGHSSGGRSLHYWCIENQVNPMNLYLGWAENCECQRCSEIKWYQELNPSLNKVKPPWCKIHG